jgi:hypothetical protein
MAQCATNLMFLSGQSPTRKLSRTGIWEVTILVHPKARRRAVSVHFPCLNISNPKYIRINNLGPVLSTGMELGSETAHSC